MAERFSHPEMAGSRWKDGLVTRIWGSGEQTGRGSMVVFPGREVWSAFKLWREERLTGETFNRRSNRTCRVIDSAMVHGGGKVAVLLGTVGGSGREGGLWDREPPTCSGGCRSDLF